MISDEASNHKINEVSDCFLIASISDSQSFPYSILLPNFGIVACGAGFNRYLLMTAVGVLVSILIGAREREYEIILPLDEGETPFFRVF